MIFETDHYYVDVVQAPGTPRESYITYGIINKEHKVVEAYISQLAKVIAVCKDYEYDLVRGLPTTQEVAQMISEAAAGLPGEKPAKGRLS